MMAKLIIVVFSLLSLLSACVGQMVQTGQCDENIAVQASFNPERYTGTWYDIESYPSYFQNGTCDTATYSINDDGTLNIKNTQVVGQRLETVTGTAYAVDNAKFVVAINGSGTAGTSNYWVLSTDYVTYSLVYSCRNINGTNNREVHSWKLGREKTLPTSAVTAINAVISTVQALDQNAYVVRSHTAESCFYYPEFTELPPTIELPGHCNTSIRGIADFNAQAYLGTWIEIAKYPQRDQSGECSRAEYGALPSGAVSVLNSEVINETLYTMAGEATVTSNDGSGELEVVFNVFGQVVRSNLYVLATDYTSYALAYSCANLTNGNRRVGSWKLSRTTELSPQANAAIDAMINATQGLKQDYYLPTKQDAKSCFHYPEFEQLPSAIELPGPCNASIRGIPNFNAAAYLGTWIEIAKYPQRNQSGECSRAEYGALLSGAVSVLNSEVINETLYTMAGEARVTSNDGSGELEVVFNVVGQVVPSNLYVLATDYTSYALAYSCANLTNGNRRVGSWKLSRTTELSTQANAAIDAVINATQGLKQDYYLPTKQDAESCFHYPEFEQLPPAIELPGPCNASIRGISNFNAAAYLGTWIEIAKYPQRDQSGECSRAEYGALPSGAVSVLNSEVINETLYTMAGEATVTSNDGSGELEVVFNVFGQIVRSNLYVLATDYTNYALAYSCANLTNGNRRVGSWKLSRTTELSPQANAAIDVVINATQGLKQDYYLPTKQDAESCFHYPEFEQLPPAIELPGPCNASIRGISNFNAAAYLGTWIEIAKYPQRDQSGECSRAEYGALPSGAVSVLNSEVINETLYTMAGEATVTSNDGSGELEVVFNVFGQIVRSNLYVLATDYTSYALAYSCANLTNGNRRVGSWKLSRTTELSTQANAAIDAVINATQGLKQDYYLPTKQDAESCFHYPEFEQLPPAIELPGPCNTSIRGISNFNAAAYLGTWIEIAKYPQRDQSGECSRAEYGALPSGAVSVLNSEVINETLYTMAGEATVTSNDGSGELEVVFNVFGQVVRSNLYVLATDYTSYALAYSCANLTNGNRRVGSWKLSRTTELSTQANAAIDAVINATQGLKQDYYLPTKQDAESCFHYPEFEQLPPAIELPGPCNTSIRGISNFNAAAYLGTWIEIAKYPQRDQSGECSRAEYGALPSGAVSVLNSEVINETLYTMAGEATVTSNDGSGELEVVFNVFGQVVRSNLYVLATDYTSYALAYSCANLTNGNRRVGSWKLSRTTELSTQANAAIDAVINATQGLKQDYYLPTKQDAESCFHYPEFEQLPPAIELPGPCNTSIRGISNFNAAAYLGTWIEIAKYPQRDQSGECSRAEYGALPSGAVSVLNSEVINETLYTMAGEATVTSNDGSGELEVVFNVFGQLVRSNLYVLATDYTSYALAYSCANLTNGNRRVGSWKLSRTTELSTQANAAIDAVINATQGLKQDYYLPTKQDAESCFHYPEFEQLPPAIELPGPCNTSIRGISNFNAAAYLGTWIEIAKYPQRDQSGECSRAEYGALPSGAVSVLNSEVINETLYTMAGEATVTSNDGSGELEVVFNVFGQVVRSNLYVLATDYTSYALAYSCANLTNGNRRVGSWKLSRTTELSPQANAAIDAVINATQGLKQDYYLPTKQDAESCFYYPAFEQLPSAIELPGRCDTSVRGIPSFNAAAYVGTWFEIARYPQADQSGECSRAEYGALPSGAVSVLNSEVINETLYTMAGEATVTSNDGSGELEVVFNVFGEIRRSNLYVLATDYTSYALAYSCVNLHNGNRQVSSWKLSRTTELSAQANAAIDSVISATRGLNQNYYRVTSHSHESCFHYPMQTGARVVMPGQCNESIPVVPFFDIDNFGGTWYQIQRYDAVEGRSCIGSRLSYDEGSGDIRVNFVEVVNEEVLRIEGSARLNSTDQSGRFSLFMPVNGSQDAEKIETKIYILATDYEGYALAYSCKNIDTSQRQVSVWQLSRERTMSEAGATAIAQLIAQRPELHLPYFKPITHGEDCPQPSSAILVKSSIIVMLVCSVLQLLC